MQTINTYCIVNKELFFNTKHMIIRKVMQMHVYPLTDDMPLVQAVEFLIQKRLLGTPVINNAGDMVGFLSEKDLFKSLFPTYANYYKNPAEYILENGFQEKVEGIENKSVRDIMSDKVVYAEPDEDILSVGNKMLTNNIHKIPVVEDGKPIGMVSRIDIYRAILKKYFDLDMTIHTP